MNNSELRIKDDGSKEWVFNGKLHREDGPAIEYTDGTKEWWLNGTLHREDGPAVEYPDGSSEWWLNGGSLSDQEIKLLQLNQESAELVLQDNSVQRIKRKM